MRVLAGLLPVLAALGRVEAAETSDLPSHSSSTTAKAAASQGTLDMGKVPDGQKQNVAKIPITTPAPVTPKVLSSASSIWESLKSEKLAERSRLATTTTTTTAKGKSTKKTKIATSTTTTKKDKPKPTPKPTPKKNKKKKEEKQHGRRQATGTTNPAPAAVGAPGSNDGCSINFQSLKSTYTPTPNTPLQFMSDSNLISNAAAQWLPPAGYWTSFQNQVAQTVLTANNQYIMYAQLATYDPSQCAAFCTVRDECLGFNIYYSRSPMWEPQYSNATNPSDCTNPVAAAEVGCGFYRQFIYSSMSTNTGQWRSNFALVTNGNNGYNKNPVPAPVANYRNSTALIGAVNGFNTPYYIGNQYFSTGAFDNTRCASACTSYTQSQRAAAIAANVNTYQACNYYNSFNLTYQGTYQGQYCVLYNDSAVLNSGYMTYTTQTYNGVTYLYNLTNSWGSPLYGPDYGTVSPAWSPAPTGAAAACSSLGGTGSTLIDTNQVNFTIACGYDVNRAADIGNATAPDFYSCMDLCVDFTGCSGYSWFQGVCYFKALTGFGNPPLARGGVDMAWMTGKYAGLSAGQQVATVTYVTYTTAWTGTVTKTTTSFNDVTGYIIVQTPGAQSTSTSGLVTVTSVTDSGTAITPFATTGTTTNTVTVVSVYPTAACQPQSSGVSFAFYSNSFMGGQNTNSYPAYTPTVYKTTLPRATGVAKYIAEDNADTAATTIYGRANTDGRSLVIQHTFYIYAGRGSGRYYFQIPYTDDIQFLWVGSTAISGWNRANADLLQFWNGSPQTPVTASFFLTNGTYTPVRIQWANGGGQGDMQMSIIDPNGYYLAQSTPGQNAGFLSPQILRAPCGFSQAPAFPPFGRET